jgi:hypothetical protein
MRAELTNLLPPERLAALRRDYLFRLGTVALATAALLIVAHGVLLAPAYLYARERIVVAEERLAELSARRAVSGYEDLSARIAAFSARAGDIEKLAAAPSAADAVRAILDLPRRGIALESFAYTPPDPSGKGGRMTVSGIADARDALRAFNDDLGKLPFVASTDLPLSAYAKETAIDFSIALVLDYTTP